MKGRVITVLSGRRWQILTHSTYFCLSAWLGSSKSPALQPACSSVTGAVLSRSPRVSLLQNQYTLGRLGVLDLSGLALLTTPFFVNVSPPQAPGMI